MATGPSISPDPTCLIDVDLDGLPAALGDIEGLLVPNSNGLFATDDGADGLDNDADGSPDGIDPHCIDNDGDHCANTIDSEGPQGSGSRRGVAGGDDRRALPHPRPAGDAAAMEPSAPPGLAGHEPSRKLRGACRPPEKCSSTTLALL